jgi:Protein of unknown function (DUF4058)
MPMHDWTRVKSGTYHNFHMLWMANITNRLNAGLLPSGFFAMAEQIVGQPETDVVALQTGPRAKPRIDSNGGVAVAPFRPKARFVMAITPDQERYARRTNRVVIHHELGEVVAVIEIVSPGNKDRKRSFRTFVDKAVDLIQQQVNLLIIDPFPPGAHDPQGIHGAIWEEFADQQFALPADKPLTMVAYQVAPIKTSYVEPIAVGDLLPEMPLFLFEEYGINVPLEETYRTTWNVLPSEIRRLLEPPAQP